MPQSFCPCRVDKACYSLDLRFMTPLDATPAPPESASGPPAAALTSSPFAHIVTSALLRGPTKAVRTHACAFLKSLWLLESVKAVKPNSVTCLSAQRAQHAMLTLLLHWVPTLPAYPEACQLYIQMLTWIMQSTPALASNLESGSKSTKQKSVSSSSNSSLKLLTAGGNRSGGSGAPAVAKGQAFDQLSSSVMLAAIPSIFAAVKRQSRLLADHPQSTVYHALQVRG